MSCKERYKKNATFLRFLETWLIDTATTARWFVSRRVSKRREILTLFAIQSSIVRCVSFYGITIWIFWKNYFTLPGKLLWSTMLLVQTSRFVAHSAYFLKTSLPPNDGRRFKLAIPPPPLLIYLRYDKYHRREYICLQRNYTWLTMRTLKQQQKPFTFQYIFLNGRQVW